MSRFNKLPPSCGLAMWLTRATEVVRCVNYGPRRVVVVALGLRGMRCIRWPWRTQPPRPATRLRLLGGGVVLHPTIASVPVPSATCLAVDTLVAAIFLRCNHACPNVANTVIHPLLKGALLVPRLCGLLESPSEIEINGTSWTVCRHGLRHRLKYPRQAEGYPQNSHRHFLLSFG